MSILCWLGFHKKDTVVGLKDIVIHRLDGSTRVEHDVPVATLLCVRCSKMYEWERLPRTTEEVEGN
jgi:hypothetical protein